MFHIIGTHADQQQRVEQGEDQTTTKMEKATTDLASREAEGQLKKGKDQKPDPNPYKKMNPSPKQKTTPTESQTDLH